MTYSMSDIYSGNSGQMKTNDQTIPDDTEFMDAETATNSSGQNVVQPKGQIWGAIVLLVGVMVFVHFI